MSAIFKHKHPCWKLTGFSSRLSESSSALADPLSCNLGKTSIDAVERSVLIESSTTAS